MKAIEVGMNIQLVATLFSVPHNETKRFEQKAQLVASYRMLALKQSLFDIIKEH